MAQLLELGKHIQAHGPDHIPHDLLQPVRLACYCKHVRVRVRVSTCCSRYAHPSTPAPSPSPSPKPNPNQAGGAVFLATPTSPPSLEAQARKLGNVDRDCTG